MTKNTKPENDGNESNTQRKLLLKTDIYIIAAVVVLCVGVLLWMALRGRSTEDEIAVISYQGKTVRTVSLNSTKNEVFQLEENPKVSFQVENHRIRFVNTDCPDHLCENVGYIDRSGQVAICLPNQVTLKIIGGSNDLDIIVN